MKFIFYSSIILLLFISNHLVAQGFVAQWNPEDTFCFIKLDLTLPQGTPYAQAPVVLKGIKGHRVSIRTDKNGKVKAKVPYDDTYTVHCGQDSCMKSISIDKFPYVTYNFKSYTRRFIYFTFTYKTPAGLPLSGEAVEVTSTQHGQQYLDTTNAKGQCYFVLPFDPQFNVAVKYHPSVSMLNPIDVGKEYKVMSANFSWMGSKEKDRRAHIADSLARLRHLRDSYIIDSLLTSTDLDGIAELDIPIPLDYDSTDLVQQFLQKKAEAYKKALQKDKDFFEKKDKIVLAPLHRLVKKQANRIIVTDITGSMYGYMEQVMLWHALNFMGQQTSRYLFFNDGDNKPTEMKKIGSTGGLYYCEGAFKDFKHILRTMRKGMRNGGGGEYPENDVEALLAAAQKANDVDELVLVADNFSPVRDLSLMYQLKLPVRIVVCGVEAGGSAFWGYDHPREINEEYLNLARASGGSVHTVKEDILDLSEVKEGESITIQGTIYNYEKGRFVAKTKS